MPRLTAPDAGRPFFPRQLPRARGGPDGTLRPPSYGGKGGGGEWENGDACKRVMAGPGFAACRMENIKNPCMEHVGPNYGKGGAGRIACHA